MGPSPFQSPAAILRRRVTLLALATLAVPLSPSLVEAQNTSAPVILQWFESTYKTQERRIADAFSAGYGQIYLPPTGRADSSDFSVGYDVYDRFDLGKPGKPTLYGTETGLKTAINVMHRSGMNVYADFVVNHSGFKDSSSVDNGHSFVNAGDYPGFVVTYPGTSDGDYHSAFPDGSEDYDIQYRLAGLIDIDHRTNLRFIRSPVPGFANNIPAGTVSAYGRIADVPDENNRRFYPDRSLPGKTLSDPRTGAASFTVYPFNTANPMAGDPVEENAMGYLMRNAQWMIQEIGVDGFRVDAARHVEPWVHEFMDRAVFQANPRPNLDGSQKQVFSFLEAYTGDKAALQSFIRKDISPTSPNTVGGNRDVLDFPLFFALRSNLTGNGTANNWFNIRNASQDSQDDGLANNGSQGVAFAASHDDGGEYLSNVAHAYILMRPGNALVYFNAHEHGDNRDFPKDGMKGALGGYYGDAIPKLVDIRNRYGRGNFQERWIDNDPGNPGFSNIYVYERLNSAIVALNSRLDGGYDERVGVQTAFAPGTRLVELTGNASDPLVDPNDDIHPVLTVNNAGKIDIRIPRNKNNLGQEHDRGYVIYGPATPQGSLSIVSTNGSTLAGQTPSAATNATNRLSDIDVVRANTFQVKLNTNKVNLLANPALHELDADGDNAVVKFDDGRDINGTGQVDYRTPGSVVYGFEEFKTTHTPGYTSADNNGLYVQNVDASNLEEGYHFVEVRAFRHRNSGEPALYTSFRRTLYVDRLKPISAIDSFDPIVAGINENRRVTVRSTDLTADNVHIFLDLPASLSEDQVVALQGSASQSSNLDRDLWTKDFSNLTNGNHVVTVLTYEMTGNRNVQRFPGRYTSTIFGAGLGDLNFNGGYAPDDVNAFSTVLNSQNSQFNPAADLNGDGLIDETDLLQLGPRLTSVSADAPTQQAYNTLLINPTAGLTRNVTALFDNHHGSSLVKDSAGAIVIAGPQSHGLGAALSITAGDLTLASDAGSPSAANLALTVSSGAALHLTASQHLKSLSVLGGRADLSAAVLATSALTLDGTGDLDLASGDLIVRSSASNRSTVYSQLAGWIAAARHGGAWDGHGLRSSDAAILMGTGLAAIVNDDAQGGTITATFDGESVGLNDVLVKFTYNGDANLNGIIDPDDYLQLDSRFAASSGPIDYRHGDFNYDGRIDARDYFLLSSTLGS